MILKVPNPEIPVDSFDYKTVTIVRHGNLVWPVRFKRNPIDFKNLKKYKSIEILTGDNYKWVA